MTTLQAKNLSLQEVHQLLGYQRQYADSFTSLLSLETLTEFEQQEIEQIRHDFDDYLAEGKVLEGMVKVLTVFPLMRLAGFYRSPIKISLEENIDNIAIEDEDTLITGRFDILSANKTTSIAPDTNLWVLLIESKNSSIAASAGLPQLLAYAYGSLEHQPAVWGLTTNGENYRFARIQQGTPPTYQLLPDLNLMDRDPAHQLLQTLKAIGKLQSAPSPTQDSHLN